MGPAPSCGYRIARALVLSPIRRVLGLHECRALFSGAAPLNARTLTYFRSLDMPLCEVYGMSECTGPQTYNVPHDTRQGA